MVAEAEAGHLGEKASELVSVVDVVERRPLGFFVLFAHDLSGQGVVQLRDAGMSLNLGVRCPLHNEVQGQRSRKALVAEDRQSLKPRNSPVRGRFESVALAELSGVVGKRRRRYYQRSSQTCGEAEGG